MKIGRTNKLVASEITSISTETPVGGFDEVNILDDDSLKLFKFEDGAGTLTLEWTTGIVAQMISVFNLNVETSIEIKTYSAYPGTVIETKTMTAAQLTGFKYLNAFFELESSTPIVAIDLIWTGPSSSFNSSAGYIWVGDMIDFGCSEKIQPFDESADQVTLGRTNAPDINEEYLFQSYNVTINKDEIFEDLRTKMRYILTDGYAIKRPILIDEPFLSNEEVFLGSLDAPRVAYDIFETEDFEAQTTVGLREVT